MSSSEAKRQRTHPTYTLLYHPGIPGRGEFIRLVFEATGVPYVDAGPAGQTDDVYGACNPESTGVDGNPPGLAPPMLRVSGAGKNGKPLLISQTANIIRYLGRELEFDGNDAVEALWANQLALTALDVNNEVHDTHHPIDVSAYYEDQKEEALKRAESFREARVPKFLGYFERTLKGNKDQGGAKYLVGNKLTFADTTLWQIIDGIKFAFPKELEAREKDFPLLFETFYPSVKEHLKDYLASDRRIPYGQGVFRYYKELDRQ